MSMPVAFWGATAAPSGTVRADTFTRADSATSMGTPSDGGSAYVVGTGTWGISGNRGYNVSTGGDFVIALETGRADGTFTTSFAGSAGGSYSGGDMGLVFRYVDSSNFMLALFAYTGSGVQVSLYQKVAGSFTLIGTGGVLGSPTGLVQARVVYTGASIQIKQFYGGVWNTIITNTSSQFLTATKVGYRTSSTIAVYLTNATVS